MIELHWSRIVKPHSITSANLVFDQNEIQIRSQYDTPGINGPQANAELLKPLLYITGTFTAGFLAEAGKQTFRALAPSIKTVFTSLFSSIDFNRTSIKPGQRKFAMINVCVHELGGPRVTFMFTDEDEEQYIDIMIDKAKEFIFSPIFQDHIQKYDSYSYQNQMYLMTLKLQFDKTNLVWKPFDLSQYVVNGKLMINQE